MNIKHENLCNARQTEAGANKHFIRVNLVIIVNVILFSSWYFRFYYYVFFSYFFTFTLFFTIITFDHNLLLSVLLKLILISFINFCCLNEEKGKQLSTFSLFHVFFSIRFCGHIVLNCFLICLLSFVQKIKTIFFAIIYINKRN